MVKVTQLLLILVAQQNFVAGRNHQTQLTDEQKRRLMKQQTQFLRLPCSCSGDHCGCCAMLSVPVINFNQKGCIQLTYVPEDVGVRLDVVLNDKSVYQTSLSARNPPPFCVGTGVPLLNVCVRVYDIRIQGQSVRACANLELQFANRPLIVVSFDCVRISTSGISLEKPPPAGLVRGPDPIFKSNVKTSHHMLITKVVNVNSRVENLPLTLFTSVNSVSGNLTNKQDLSLPNQCDKNYNKLQL